MDIYREEILEHYKNPKNFGEIKDATSKARDANASCGDLIEIWIKLRSLDDGREASLKDDDAVIEGIKFKGVGCAISIAASSLLTQELKGKTLKEARDVNLDDMRDLLGVDVSSARVKCLTLPLRALEKCLTEEGES